MFLFYNIFALVSLLLSPSDFNPIVINDYLVENISEKTAIHIDSTGELLIQKLMDSTSAFPFKFKLNNEKGVYLPANPNILWLKVVLRNESLRGKSVFLEIQNPSISEIEYFVIQNNLLIKPPPEGSSKPFTKRRFKQRYNIQQIILDSESSATCYVKLQNENIPAYFSVMLYGEKGYLLHAQNDIVKSGVFYGILITLVFSALLLFLIDVNRSSLISFLFYTVSTLILLVNYDGIGFQYLFPNSVWIQHNIRFIMPYLMYASLLQLFMATFPELCKKNNFICGIAVLLTITSVITAIIRGFFNFGYLFDLLLTNLLAIVVLGLIISILVVGKLYSTKAGKIVTLAILAHLIFIAGVNSLYFPTGSSTGTIEMVIKISSLAHLLLLFAALVYQIGLYHHLVQNKSLMALKNLSNYKEKANIELEKTVRERTKALQEANIKLNQLIKHNKEITEQLFKQKEEIELKNRELELAFKKSSAQHIKLHKALLINVEQQKKLSETLEIIQEKNQKLEQKNEEINSQQEKIKEQNTLLEERARDITDSILYAERLQSAFFTPLEKVREIFPESFIFFKPKDILSGDIYWFDVLTDQNNRTLRLAAAIDCTGHGIPGALMSVIARDILSDAINNKHLSSPDDILNYMNEIIVNIFNKKNNINHVKDGMDMSLILVDYQSKTLHFAGARNPIWIISDSQLQIIKGHIHSVGTVDYDNELITFPKHSIQFKSGDMIFLFSDGFVDQFGGEKGLKFRHQRFSNLLLSITPKTIDEQLLHIEKTFQEWKQGYEQVDDVLVIGIRL